MSGPPGGIVSPLEFASTIPDTAVVCSDLRIAWFGGVPPYVLSYSPTNVPTTTTVISQLSTTSFTWKVNAIPFSQNTLNVVDSAGTAIHSTNIGVQSGIDTSCVNFSTTGASTTTSAKSTSSIVNISTSSKQTSATLSSSTTISGTSTQSSSGSSGSTSSTSTSVSSSSRLTSNTDGLTTMSSSGSSAIPFPTAAVNSNQQSGGSSRTHIGAIVGGVIGGIFLILAIIFFLLLKRRRERNRQNFEGDLNADGNAIEPFRRETMVAQAPVSFGHGAVTGGKGQLVSIPIAPVMSTNMTSNNKSREAQRELGPDTPEPQASSISESSLPQPPQDVTNPGPRPQVMRHEDSGIRMPANDHDEIVELPPLYTPG